MKNKYKGPEKFAACFGKSTIEKNDPDYALIASIAEILVQNRIGVIHGGYGGGAMEAVDESAVATAESMGYENPQHYSLGVPVECFEEGYGKTTKGTRLDPVRSVEERLETIDQYAAFYVVLPRGGTGTAHEMIHFVLRSAVFVKTPKPMIVFGDHWKELLMHFFRLSDTSDTVESFPWIHFVNTLEDFKGEMDKVVKNLK